MRDINKDNIADGSFVTIIGIEAMISLPRFLIPV